MMMNKYILITTLFLLTAVASLAVENKDFLSYQGLSARTLAMGELTGIKTCGADAVFSNPALLVSEKRMEILSSYSNPLGQSTQWGIAVAPISLGVGKLGFGYLGFQPDTLKQTSTTMIIGDLAADDKTLLLGYGIPLFSGISAGVNMGYVESTIGSISGTGWTLDAGALYRCSDSLSLTALIKNLFATSLSWTNGTNETFARQYSVGAELEVELMNNPAVLELKMANQSFGDALEVSAGAEYVYNRFLSLRAGTNARYPVTLGLGLNLWNLTLDYAYLAQSYFSTQKISFSIEI